MNLMRWLTNFYDFRLKWTDTAGIWIHPTKSRLSQLVNFKNTIWTWGYIRRTICNKKSVLNLKKMPQKRMECFRLLLEHLAWIEHQFFEWHKRLREVRESVRDDERCGRSKEVNTPELIGQRARVRVRVTMLRFLREFRKRFRRKRPALFKSGQWHFQQDNAPVHNSVLLTDYLTKMRIKTVPHPPYSPDLDPCDFWSFPKFRGCRYEIIEEMKEAVQEGHWHTHTRGLPWGLPEVLRTVQHMHCSRRRLLRRGLKFNVCTINKSAP